MSHTRLIDPRDITIDDADRLMQTIADLEVSITKQHATAEARIERIKDALADQTRAEELQHDQAIAAIERAILAHPEWFKRPRTRKTTFGQYGMRTCTRLHIDDQDQLIALLEETRNADLLRKSTTVDRQQLTKTLKAGATIIGARLDESDVPFFKVEKALIDQAKTTS